MLDIMNKLTKNSSKIPTLSPMRQRFADAILSGMNQTQACIEAGYSAKSAKINSYRLKVNEGIQAYIAYKVAETAERNKISQDEIVRKTRQTIDRCMQTEPVLDKKGKQVFVETEAGEFVAAYTFQAAAVLKGLELLAKMGGYLREQGIAPDQRPAFTGLIINMGNGTVKKILSGGNSGGNSNYSNSTSPSKSGIYLKARSS